MTKSGKRDCPKTMNGVHTFRDDACVYCGAPDNREKIKQRMMDAAACARGECDCPETTYTVRNRPGRVSVTNQTTGQTTIYPANN